LVGVTHDGRDRAARVLGMKIGKGGKLGKRAANTEGKSRPGEVLQGGQKKWFQRISSMAQSAGGGVNSKNQEKPSWENGGPKSSAPVKALGKWWWQTKGPREDKEPGGPV